MKLVYFPSCTARLMGLPPKASESLTLSAVIVKLLDKAGCQIITLENRDQLCCGLPFHSKGLSTAYQQKSAELIHALYQATDNGQYPILCDNSHCTLMVKTDATQPFKTQPFNIYEPVAFINQFLVDRLHFVKKVDQVMIHPTCSTIKMKLNNTFISLAKRCAERVIVPVDVNCCGFAGDKGFTCPELNDSALLALKNQVPPQCDRGYSNSMTCEIGLSAHTGLFYRSIVYLVDECTESINTNLPSERSDPNQSSFHYDVTLK